jgi:type I restriction enzyme S subunit
MNVHFGEFKREGLAHLDDAQAQALQNVTVRKRDVLLNITGASIGRVCLAPDDMSGARVNQHVCIIRIAEELPPTYVERFLAAPDMQRHILEENYGFTRQALTKGMIERFKIPLPPAAEQYRIVEKLNVLADRLARARAELDRAECLQRKIRSSALSQTFAKYSSDTSERLDSLCRVGTGSTPKRGDARYYSGGTIAWITSGVVNQRFVSEPTEFITEAAIKETNCKVFPAGSLLVALYGEGKTRGKVARLGIAEATNQALAVLHSFEERVDPEWINLFLEARYQQTREEAAGGVQPNLNLGIIKAIRLPVPALDEQRAAILKTNVAFACADRLEVEAARARALLDRLESAILTKAFNGDLLPQDPDDEPASVLLDRLQAQRASAPKAKRKPTSGHRITA